MVPQRWLLMARFYSDYVVRSPFSKINVPEVTVDQLVWSNISKWEDKIAIECGKTGTQLTYKELRRKSKSLARNLSSFRLAGETALIVMHNCPEYAAAILGSLEAGMAVSAANPTFKSDEFKYQANDSGAKVIITAPEHLELVRSAGLDIPVICTGEEQLEGTHSLKQMTESPGSADSSKTEERLKNLAFLPYSSGVTGLPKGVKLSHKNVVANILQMSHPQLDFIREASGDHQDVLPAILPFFHIYGLTVIMLRGLFRGVKLVTLPKFDPPAFLNILRNNKEIVLHAVPPVVSFLAQRPEVARKDLVGLRHTMTAGAPCSLDDLEKLYEKKSHLIIQAYGLTESSPGLTLTTKESTDKSTVGFPLSNTIGRIVEQGTGKPLPPGARGEICFKGPQVMLGYQKRPEATSEALDKDGWLHTGDLGYADEKGQFYVVDRFKEIIKVKGFQVAPAELEHLLRKYPAIEDAGVTGVPSVREGERPVAFVVLKQGHSFKEDKVLEWLDQQISPYKKPARVIALDQIPKTLSGKILRKDLKSIARDIKLE